MRKAPRSETSVLGWGLHLSDKGAGRHRSRIFAVMFHFYLTKEASEANGQNYNIYVVFMKDTETFVSFSTLFGMLEIFHI